MKDQDTRENVSLKDWDTGENGSLKDQDTGRAGQISVIERKLLKINGTFR